MSNPIQASWPLTKPQQLVYVELGPDNGGMILGICQLGFSFRAVAPIREQGPVSFSFALDGTVHLKGVGELAWLENDAKAGGLKFTSVTPDFRETLRAWLAGEALPKNVGREITPAAELRLDSLEKIKSQIRERNTADIKTSSPQPPVDESFAPKLEVESQQPKLPEARSAQTSRPEPEPAAVPLVYQNLVETKPPIDAKSVDATPTEARLGDAKSADSVSIFSKFVLPSATPPSPPTTPILSSQSEAPPAPSPLVDPPAFTASPELQKEYPPLPGLHQPYAHVPPEAEEADESPRLNRAVAAAIIALALSVILVALVLSFHREIGETLIRLGEKLAQEPRTSVADTGAENLKQSQSVYANAAPSQAQMAPSSPQPTSSSPASVAASQPAKVRRIEDLPAPTDGGTGQKEFEQARGILKGSHRVRDLSAAVDLLWTGVRKGYVPAQVTLADLYARGDGVEQSCEQARVLLQAAVQKGSPEGRRRMDQLNRRGCPSN